MMSKYLENFWKSSRKKIKINLTNKLTVPASKSSPSPDIFSILKKKNHKFSKRAKIHEINKLFKCIGFSEICQKFRNLKVKRINCLNQWCLNLIFCFIKLFVFSQSLIVLSFISVNHWGSSSSCCNTFFLLRQEDSLVDLSKMLASFC
jgi:hypothetical protein